MNTTIFLFLVIYITIGFITLGLMARYIFRKSNTPDPLTIVLFWPIALGGLVLCGAYVILEGFCNFCRKGK